MTKHFCDRCYKEMPTYDLKRIKFIGIYEFCTECYDKIVEFTFNGCKSEDEFLKEIRKNKEVEDEN